MFMHHRHSRMSPLEGNADGRQTPDLRELWRGSQDAQIFDNPNSTASMNKAATSQPIWSVIS